MSNRYLPISIALKQHRILVVGGGKVAMRKIDTLLDFEAELTVVAPAPIDRVEYYASSNRLKLEKREYRSPEASQYGLVIAASDQDEVNRQVYDDCRKAGVLVNIVDNPALCSFIFPAMMQRDCLSVAISTDGRAPFLAAHLRLIMENMFPEHWRKIARLAGEYRLLVKNRWSGDPKERLASLARFLEADWKTMVKDKDDEQLRRELELMLEPDYQPSTDGPKADDTAR